MIDEIHDRVHQDGREQLHAGIDLGVEKLRRGIATTFQLMHKIQYARPWNRSNDIGCA